VPEHNGQINHSAVAAFLVRRRLFCRSALWASSVRVLLTSGPRCMTSVRDCRSIESGVCFEIIFYPKVLWVVHKNYLMITSHGLRPRANLTR
jgi:hypothetical protein